MEVIGHEINREHTRLVCCVATCFIVSSVTAVWLEGSPRVYNFLCWNSQSPQHEKQRRNSCIFQRTQILQCCFLPHGNDVAQVPCEMAPQMGRLAETLRSETRSLTALCSSSSVPSLEMLRVSFCAEDRGFLRTSCQFVLPLLCVLSLEEPWP